MKPPSASCRGSLYFSSLKNGWHIIGHVTLWLGELLNGSFSTYFLHFLIVYTLKTIRANQKSSSICWITGSYFETITRKLWQQHLSVILTWFIHQYIFAQIYKCIGTIYDITVPCHGKEFYQYYLVYTYFNKVQRQIVWNEYIK